MAATVTIVRLTGAGPTATDITGLVTRMAAEDAHSVGGTSNPVQIPDTGNTNRSYWVTTRLSASTSPSSVINNIKWYTDGANGLGTGITMKVAQATSYVQATGTQGVSGTELTTGNHAGLTGSPVNAFTYTSASPLSVTGSLSNPNTGQFGNMVVMQIEVADNAGPGASASETITWRYDEV